MDKKFETLTELYKGFRAFRVCMNHLHKAHSDFLNHLDSKIYARWNDESVEFTKSVLFTAFSLGCIDEFNYSYFDSVLFRYASCHKKIVPLKARK